MKIKKPLPLNVIIIDMVFAAMSYYEFLEAADRPAGSLSRSRGFFMGKVDLFIAVLIALMLIINRIRINRIIAKGNCVRAEFCSLNSVRDRKRHITHYTLSLSYENPENGIVYKFKTDIALRHDPAPFLKEHGLPVYIDSGKLWNYYVDVTELIELG